MNSADELKLEPTALQRRVFFSFCATVFLGVLLCVFYLAGRVMGFSPQQWVVVSASAPPALHPQPVSPQPATIDAEQPDLKPYPLKLDMVATQDAWVEVETDGQPIYASLVRADQALSFAGTQRIFMLTGNAPGLELRFNGEAVMADSSKRVRRVEFTSEGMRDLKAAPPVTKD